MTAYVHLTDAASMGGRGKEARVPEDRLMHTVTMTAMRTEHFEDWYVTAEQAIEQRAKRLKDAGTPYTRDGMTLRFTDGDGGIIELSYKDVS